jgi:feS assembly protein iscX
MPECRPNRYSAAAVIRYNPQPEHPKRIPTMKWTDTHRIAEELFDTHGESIDPHTLRFTQLRDLVLALPDFDDDPARCGEKILEAIQQAWIDEAA